MTSKIVVNNIEADAGISTVTFNSNVERGSSNLHSTGLNVNNTFVHSTGIALGAGSTIGAVTGVTTYFGDGSQLTGISVDSTKIETGNTKVETIDTGSDGHVKITTEGGEKLRIKSDGKVNITTGGTLSGGHPPGDLNIVGTNFITMTPNDNANASDNEVLGQVSFLPYGAGSIAAASAKIEAVAESGQSGSSNATSLRFYTKPSSAGPGNSGTERMRINQDGYRTIPNQPGFEASYPDAYDTSNSPSNFVTQWLRVHHNYGSHFNANNGRFTAPVDGRYLIGTIWTNVGHSNPHCAFGINGGAASGPSRGGTNYTELWHTNAGSGSGLSPVHIFDLSANDYVNVWIYGFTGTGDDPRCYFFGYLLG